MHICVGKLTIIDSGNGLAPSRRQAIIWTNAGILLIGSLGTNFNEILIGIQTFSFNKMHLKMSPAKWRPFCLGLNLLKINANFNPTSEGDNLMLCGLHCRKWHKTWWRHQMEAFSALLAICVGNSPVSGEFPAQRPVRGALMFYLIWASTNGWVNNREAGDLRRYRAHYYVIVMMHRDDLGVWMLQFDEKVDANIDISIKKNICECT